MHTSTNKTVREASFQITHQYKQQETARSVSKDGRALILYKPFTEVYTCDKKRTGQSPVPQGNGVVGVFEMKEEKRMRGHLGPRLRHRHLQVPCVPTQHPSPRWSTSGLPLTSRAQICMPSTSAHMEGRLGTPAGLAPPSDSSVRLRYGSRQLTLADASTALF